MTEKLKFSIITRFLIFCSGADLRALENCSKATKGKYVALGGLVVTPAILGMVASYYFLSTTFKTQPHVSLLGSISWALIVFNIDRYVVMTYHKGDHSRKLAAFLAVAGRLLVASLFAYTIAHALVLRLFEGNIQEYIYRENQIRKEEILKRHNSQIEKKEGDIATLSKEINDIGSLALNHLEGTSSEEIQRLRREIGQQYELLADEIAGLSKRTGKAGNGPVAKAIEAKIAYMEGQLKEFLEREKKDRLKKSQILELREKELAEASRRNNELIRDKRLEIHQIQQLKESELRTFDAKTADDFLTRSNALDDLSKNNFNILKWNWILTFLLISIDILAITLKIISAKDDYDWMIGTEQLAAESKELIKRNVTSVTKADREKMEVQKCQNGMIQEEMRERIDHGIRMLSIYCSLFEMKMKQTVDFMNDINWHNKEMEKGNEQDNKVLFGEDMSNTIQDYFARSVEITENAADFFSHNFNGRSNSKNYTASAR